MSDIITNSIARLAAQFQDSTKFKAFITAFLEEFVELETAATDLLDDRWLDTAEGVQLDGIGEIVGRDRPGGWSDDDYRFLIRIQISINNSRMAVDDTLEIMNAILQGLTVTYRCTTTLEATYTIYGTLTATQQLMLSELPKLLGVDDIDYIYYEDPEETFSFFEDTTGQGFGDTGDPLVGGVWSVLI